MTHPLADAVALAESLLWDPQGVSLTDDQRRRLSAITQHGAAGLGLLDRVGGLIELSGRGFQSRPERTDPRWVAHDAVAALRARAHAKNVSLILSERAAGLSAQVDPARLRQLLLNLIAYAIHDSAPDSEVRLSFEPRASGVGLTIAAPGVVLSNGQLDRLFDAPRADFETDFDLIGASLCRNLAEAIGAALIASRADGGGLRIELDLPLAPPCADEIDAGAGPTLLLFTADAIAAASLRRQISRVGAQLFVVSPDEEPGALARDLQPDAILIDAPRAAEAFRMKAMLDAAPLTRGIPVLGLSRAHGDRDERAALGVGFAGWMPWPVQPGALRRVIDIAAQVSRQQKAA
jgi:hypothetical protein